MDIYHVWCDLKEGTTDTAFSDALTRFLGALQEQNKIASWRLTRCKLGLTTNNLPEWHIMIETHDLAQLDTAFRTLAPKSGEDHERHFSANSFATNLSFALYRDWPDLF